MLDEEIHGGLAVEEDFVAVKKRWHLKLVSAGIPDTLEEGERYVRHGHEGLHHTIGLNRLYADGEYGLPM